ncbi:hypothetical protein GDO86_016266 [Hymenochirus boettgeri]|uniref:Uncharacterized protein n=1 Tax=Hymenochirus boettgeri TaxID=247094 RepID=A0A8T2JZN7_9PIPI|nr:hypothetical protein GDO86_016266 [Hymenochirus boettgeri]
MDCHRRAHSHLPVHSTSGGDVNFPRAGSFYTRPARQTLPPISIMGTYSQMGGEVGRTAVSKSGCERMLINLHHYSYSTGHK